MSVSVDVLKLRSYTSLNSELKEKISEWVAWDKNPNTLKEIIQLVEENNVERMSSLLLQRQSFGTAGIRGLMEVGFNSFNDLMIIQTTQGLAKYLRTLDTTTEDSSVVIGFDGRHNSERFAQLSARVMSELGFKVYLFRRIVSTPIVAFATRYYSAAAGIVITASHNPKEYNGYKVFFSNGAQILSPHDTGIQTSILQNLQPWNDRVWNVELLKNDSRIFDPFTEVTDKYYEALKKFATHTKVVQNTDLKVVYTSLHGVGHDFVTRAFDTLGFKNYYPVMSQKDPDPEFPTVTFPNPEEGEGVLDEAMKTAKEREAKVIFANDPDTDRFALAEFNEGKWYVFNGNEIGALFGWWTWHQHCGSERKLSNPSDCYMISSTVSSKILESIAKLEGFKWVETLTGFKWMANIADQLERQGKHVLLAFEEAIGFMVGTNVYDKDGIGAAASMLQMAAYLRTQNATLLDQLKAIYHRYGFHFSLNSYYICHELDKIERIFNRMNNFNGPNTYIDNVNGVKVTRIRDLIRGYDSAEPDHKAQMQQNTMLTFYFESGSVLTLRTSGTEPKIKYYSEMAADPKEKDWDKIKQQHEKLVNCAVELLLEPEKNGLQMKK